MDKGDFVGITGETPPLLERSAPLSKRHSTLTPQFSPPKLADPGQTLTAILFIPPLTFYVEERPPAINTPNEEELIPPLILNSRASNLQTQINRIE